jgi:hypothetical protein
VSISPFLKGAPVRLTFFVQIISRLTHAKLTITFAEEPERLDDIIYIRTSDNAMDDQEYFSSGCLRQYVLDSNSHGGPSFVRLVNEHRASSSVSGEGVLLRAYTKAFMAILTGLKKKTRNHVHRSVFHFEKACRSKRRVFLHQATTRLQLVYHKGKIRSIKALWHNSGGGMLIIKIEFHGVVLRKSR